MKLIGSPTSPYVRKVRIFIQEKSIACEFVVDRPSMPGSSVPQFNPLGKVPVLVRDDGRAVYDSSVIVEYLDGVSAGPKLIPESFEDRIEVRRWEALADGMVDATVEIAHDSREPEEKRRSTEWYDKQHSKISRALAVMNRDLGTAQFCHGGRFSLADIAVAYGCGYLDRSQPAHGWRALHPALAQFAERFSARPSFQTTAPPPA